MALSAVLNRPVDVLRVVELDDLDCTARIHQTELPGGFFVSLGPTFLRAYHRTFLTSPAGVALLAERDGEVVGFVFGTVDEATHYRHVVRRDRRLLVVHGLFALVRRPDQAARFVRTRLYRYARGMVRLSRLPDTTPATKQADPRTGVLSHMAVCSSLQRSGTGTLLLEGFTSTARAQGTKTLQLATASDNVTAQKFYERCGWMAGATATDADGHQWRRYECPAP